MKDQFAKFSDNKVKYKTLCNRYENGGLKNVDIQLLKGLYDTIVAFTSGKSSLCIS